MKSQQRSSVLQAPAIHAFLILCIALVLALLTKQVVQQLAGVVLFPMAFAVLHGTFATVLARWHRMASWWLPILFCFFPAAVLLNAWQLPPAIFLAVFLFLLLLFWSTFRSQVPFYPSGRSVWQAIAALLPVGQPLRVIDIGSGLGGVVLHLAHMRPDSRFVGIELAPLPWLVSQVRRWLSASRADFVRGDYRRLNFADYDVIFAYLSPAAMTTLWQKAKMEMRPGTLLLSYEFMIEGVKPDIAIYPQETGPALYGWHM